MLIGLQNVTFEFGARTIVYDATWHIQPGDRIGLIGYNGTGKSTLLKVLVGEYSPSEGTVEKGRETTIGYLHQDLLSFDTNESIVEVAMGAFEKVKALEKEIEEIIQKLETDSSDDLLMLYSEKLHDLEVAGGYTIQHKTEEVLHGLGFSNNDLTRPYKEFSGGWRMRVLLAKMILQQPDVLLLDEPTNHLDFETVEILAEALRDFGGTVFFVSHDRTFVDAVATGILEVKDGDIRLYNGSYEEYVYNLSQQIADEQSSDSRKEKKKGKDTEVAQAATADVVKIDPKADKKAREKELKAIQKRHQTLAKEIEGLQGEQKALLAAVEKNPDQVSRTDYDRLGEIARLLETQEAEWLSLSERLELDKEVVGK